jgi:nucleoside-diphosphate-sugar epimerase
MRVVVIGASGFLGRTLCERLLERGHHVLRLTRKIENKPEKFSYPGSSEQIEYVLGRSLPNELIQFSPEVLVHLAWDGIPDFSDAKCCDNVEIQLDFLRQLNSLPTIKKVLVAGSCREYGERVGQCQETDQATPDSYFSWAKQTLRSFLELKCEELKINMIWFRVFYVYGAEQRSQSLIPTLISAFQTGKDPVIKNIHAAHDYIYIDDVIDAFLLTLEKDGCRGTYNLGSGHLTSTLELIQKTERAITGHNDFLTKMMRDQGLTAKLNGMCANIDLAKKVLSWMPKTSLSAGIQKTVTLRLRD